MLCVYSLEINQIISSLAASYRLPAGEWEPAEKERYKAPVLRKACAFWQKWDATPAVWLLGGCNWRTIVLPYCPLLFPSLSLSPAITKGRIFHLQYSFQHIWQKILYYIQCTIPSTLLNAVFTNHQSSNLSARAHSWSQTSFCHNYICTPGKGTKKLFAYIIFWPHNILKACQK